MTSTRVDPDTASAALSFARVKTGFPYVWGGRGPDEFDCSGLITWAYKAAVCRDEIFVTSDGSTTDANMAGLYEFSVDLIPTSEVVPGDIVFISDGSAAVTHGGLFVSWIDHSEFQFVNASSFHNSVISDSWFTDKAIRGQSFVSFGRLRIVAFP